MAGQRYLSLYLNPAELVWAKRQGRGYIRWLVQKDMEVAGELHGVPERDGGNLRKVAAEGLGPQVNPTADGLIDQVRRAGIDVAVSFVFPSINPGYDLFLASRRAEGSRGSATPDLQGVRSAANRREVPVPPQVDPVTGEVL